MKKIVILFLCFGLLPLYAVQKSMYDRSAPALLKSNSVNEVYNTQSLLPHNDMLEISMLNGGYFTIGTTGGKESSFDDHCNITFGHPYAITSYPLLSIDGEQKKLDEWSYHAVPHVGERNFTLQMSIENISVEWQISLDADVVALQFTAKNNDTVNHSLGSALVFDPALGQWGDGILTMGSEQFKSVGSFRGKSVYNELTITERGKSPVGLSVGLNFNGNAPQELLINNWQNIIAQEDENIELVDVAELYDLCLKMLWEERIVGPEEEVQFDITLTYNQPEIPTPLYMRWDMPSAPSITDGLLFPKKFTTSVRTMNWVRSNQTGLTIQASYPSEISGTAQTQTFSVDALQSTWMTLDLQVNDIIEDRVVPITLQCFRNQELVDELTRNVFIPAIPISYEGLSVEIDSCKLDAFPITDIFFHVANEATNAPVLNLSKDQIFFYENEQRIKDFTLGKAKLASSALADICFVLDCSGSMGDNIAQVRDNVEEFADSLLARGLDYRIAIITFSTTVDDVWDFSNNIAQLKQNLASIDLWGGEEDSPSALWRASELSWRPNSMRNIIWVTDEPYPEREHTKTQVVNRMLAYGIKVHGVGLLSLQTDWFNPIVLPTGGNFYDINGNFRDVLLSVSRMESSSEYKLSFNSVLDLESVNSLTIEIHYAGLGGAATFQLASGDGLAAQPLHCFPNPFNPAIQIQVQPFDGNSGELEIFNILGQRVRQYQLQPHLQKTITWNALDENGLPVSAGFYLVRLQTKNATGNAKQHIEKILYLK